MAEHGEVPDPSEEGTMPNSFVRTDSGALGMSWVGDRGFVGVGYSLFNSRYGIPGGGHGHDQTYHRRDDPHGNTCLDADVERFIDQ